MKKYVREILNDPKKPADTDLVNQTLSKEPPSASASWISKPKRTKNAKAPAKPESSCPASQPDEPP
jgi:hypothetical protein